MSTDDADPKNVHLKAEVARLRRQRDVQEAELCLARARIAELESAKHKLTMHVEDLGAEICGLKLLMKQRSRDREGEEDDARRTAVLTEEMPSSPPDTQGRVKIAKSRDPAPLGSLPNTGPKVCESDAEIEKKHAKKSATRAISEDTLVDIDLVANGNHPVENRQPKEPEQKIVEHESDAVSITKTVQSADVVIPELVRQPSHAQYESQPPVRPVKRKRYVMDCVLLPRPSKRSRRQDGNQADSLTHPSSTEAKDPLISEKQQSISSKRDRKPSERLRTSLTEHPPVSKKPKRAFTELPRIPKVKKMKEELGTIALPPDVIDTHLTNTPDLRIPLADRIELCIPRRFLRFHFGGSDQQLIQRFKQHGMQGRIAVFPDHKFNPHLPSRPGKPGLIFASRPDVTRFEDQPLVVFCKERGSGPAVWRYMGDYEHEQRGEVTKEIFGSQTASVKAIWGAHILCSSQVLYRAMRARIGLRKMGTAFVPGDTTELEAVAQTKKGQGIPLAIADIVDALCRGDETIGLVRMKCVAYNAQFAAKIAELHAFPSEPQDEIQEDTDDEVVDGQLDAEPQSGRPRDATAQHSHPTIACLPLDPEHPEEEEQVDELEADNALDITGLTGALSDLTDADSE